MKSLNHSVNTATLSFILILLSTTIASAQVGFQIPDYIPQRFSDLEWRISGDFDWRSNDNNPGDLNTNSYNNRQQGLMFGTDLIRKYYTPNNFYSLVSDVRISFDRVSSKSDNQNFSSTNYYSTYEHSDINKDINLVWNQELEAGKYLASNYFFSSKAEFNIYYDHLFPSEMNSYHLNRKSYSDKVITYRTTSFRSSKSTLIRTMGSFEIGLGYGRVYEGKYASTAMSMIEELRGQGLLVKELTKDEMLTLTELIYQLRQKHQVDKRIYKIDALETILDYLIEVGAMECESVLGYLTIQDVWDYFPHKKRRQFGFLAKFGIGVIGNYQKGERFDKHDERSQRNVDYYDASLMDTATVSYLHGEKEYEQEYKNHNVYIFGQISYYKPLNRRLQLNCESRWNFFLNRNGAYISDIGTGFITPSRDYLFLVYSDLHNFVNSATKLGIYYIYNSRTEFELSTCVLYENLSVSDAIWDTINVPRNQESLSIEVSSVLRYRVAIPTEIVVKLSYYNYEANNSIGLGLGETRSDYRLSGSINYYLF